jgi:predicted GIY-YIG superfamily endonuclease
MPKKPIDFSKTIIYKIWKDDDFYVGSTTDFASRKRHHKHNCNNKNAKEYNFKIYQTIREKGGWEEWQITPLEEYECKSKTQARIREEEWLVKLNATLNAKKAYCSEEEIKAYNKQYMTQYRQEHTEELKAYNKQYYQEHTEELKAKMSAKYECECGGKYAYRSKAKHERTLKHQAYLVK